MVLPLTKLNCCLKILIYYKPICFIDHLSSALSAKAHPLLSFTSCAEFRGVCNILESLSPSDASCTTVILVSYMSFCF